MPLLSPLPLVPRVRRLRRASARTVSASAASVRGVLVRARVPRRGPPRTRPPLRGGAGGRSEPPHARAQPRQAQSRGRSAGCAARAAPARSCRSPVRTSGSGAPSAAASSRDTLAADRGRWAASRRPAAKRPCPASSSRRTRQRLPRTRSSSAVDAYRGEASGFPCAVRAGSDGANARVSTPSTVCRAAPAPPGPPAPRRRPRRGGRRGGGTTRPRTCRSTSTARPVVLVAAGPRGGAWTRRPGGERWANGAPQRLGQRRRERRVHRRLRQRRRRPAPREKDRAAASSARQRRPAGAWARRRRPRRAPLRAPPRRRRRRRVRRAERRGPQRVLRTRGLREQRGNRGEERPRDLRQRPPTRGDAPPTGRTLPAAATRRAACGPRGPRGPARGRRRDESRAQQPREQRGDDGLRPGGRRKHVGHCDTRSTSDRTASAADARSGGSAGPRRRARPRPTPRGRDVRPRPARRVEGGHRVAEAAQEPRVEDARPTAAHPASATSAPRRPARGSRLASEELTRPARGGAPRRPARARSDALRSSTIDVAASTTAAARNAGPVSTAGPRRPRPRRPRGALPAPAASAPAASDGRRSPSRRRVRSSSGASRWRRPSAGQSRSVERGATAGPGSAAWPARARRRARGDAPERRAREGVVPREAFPQGDEARGRLPRSSHRHERTLSRLSAFRRSASRGAVRTVSATKANPASPRASTAPVAAALAAKVVSAAAASPAARRRTPVRTTRGAGGRRPRRPGAAAPTDACRARFGTFWPRSAGRSRPDALSPSTMRRRDGVDRPRRLGPAAGAGARALPLRARAHGRRARQRRHAARRRPRSRRARGRRAPEQPVAAQLGRDVRRVPHQTADEHEHPRPHRRARTLPEQRDEERHQRGVHDEVADLRRRRQRQQVRQHVLLGRAVRGAGERAVDVAEERLQPAALRFLGAAPRGARVEELEDPKSRQRLEGEAPRPRLGRLDPLYPAVAHDGADVGVARVPEQPGGGAHPDGGAAAVGTPGGPPRGEGAGPRASAPRPAPAAPARPAAAGPCAAGRARSRGAPRRSRGPVDGAQPRDGCGGGGPRRRREPPPRRPPPRRARSRSRRAILLSMRALTGRAGRGQTRGACGLRPRRARGRGRLRRPRGSGTRRSRGAASWTPDAVPPRGRGDRVGGPHAAALTSGLAEAPRAGRGAPRPAPAPGPPPRAPEGGAGSADARLRPLPRRRRRRDPTSGDSSEELRRPANFECPAKVRISPKRARPRARRPSRRGSVSGWPTAAARAPGR